MSFNFNFGGMPNMDLGNIQVPDFSPQDYNFDGGIGQFGQDAMTKRQEANEARNSASTQYEADVADFKDREATEAEDNLNNLINEEGIGGLQDWNWGGDVRGEPGFTPSDWRGGPPQTSSPYGSFPLPWGGGYVSRDPPREGSPPPVKYTGPSDINWGGEPGFTPSDQQYGGITNNTSQGRSPYDPVDNWGEPGYEPFIPESDIINPGQDFVEPDVSPFIDTNPFNDIWEAPTVEVTPNVGVGAGGDPTTDFAPINNPFEPVETDYDPTRDQIIDPGAPDPGTGWWDDPDAPGPDQDYWDEDEGIYEPPIDIPPPPPPPPPAPPPPPYVPPPPPMATGPTATPMNRLIAMQTGMFGGQPQGQYRPYEEPSATTYLNQPTNPRLIMHGNRGGSIRQPTRNLKKLFSNPLDKGLGQLPVMGQNDTLTQTVQAGFRPRR